MGQTQKIQEHLEHTDPWCVWWDWSVSPSTTTTQLHLHLQDSFIQTRLTRRHQTTLHPQQLHNYISRTHSSKPDSLKDIKQHFIHNNNYTTTSPGLIHPNQTHWKTSNNTSSTTTTTQLHLQNSFIQTRLTERHQTTLHPQQLHNYISRTHSSKPDSLEDIKQHFIHNNYTTTSPGLIHPNQTHWKTSNNTSSTTTTTSPGLIHPNQTHWKTSNNTSSTTTTQLHLQDSLIQTRLTRRHQTTLHPQQLHNYISRTHSSKPDSLEDIKQHFIHNNYTTTSPGLIHPNQTHWKTSNNTSSTTTTQLHL